MIIFNHFRSGLPVHKMMSQFVIVRSINDIIPDSKLTFLDNKKEQTTIYKLGIDLTLY